MLQNISDEPKCPYCTDGGDLSDEDKQLINMTPDNEEVKVKCLECGHTFKVTQIIHYIIEEIIRYVTEEYD